MRSSINLKKLPWKLIFNIAIVVLAIVLVVYFIFSNGGLMDLINSGLKVNTLWIIMAISVHLLNIAIDASIIYLFIKQTTPHFTLYNALVASMVGQFFCAVTPSSTGGQPMQILTMSRMGVKGANATSALIQKFLVWQFTITAYCILAVVAKLSFFTQTLSPFMWLLSVIGFLAQIAMIVALMLASFAKELTKKIINGLFNFLGKIKILKNIEDKKIALNAQLDSFHENNKKLNKNKTLLIKVYVLTVVQMTALFLVPYCIAKSFDISCDIFDMICAQAYVSMVSCLIPLPGGSGAAEYSFSVFFGAYFTPETIKSAILIWRTITYYGTILISAPFSRLRNKVTTEEKNDNITE